MKVSGYTINWKYTGSALLVVSAAILIFKRKEILKLFQNTTKEQESKNQELASSIQQYQFLRLLSKPGGRETAGSEQLSKIRELFLKVAGKNKDQKKFFITDLAPSFKGLAEGFGVNCSDELLERFKNEKRDSDEHRCALSMQKCTKTGKVFNNITYCLADPEVKE